MSSLENDPNPSDAVSSLDDLIVTYDMKQILSEAKLEFDSVIACRELLEQKAIGSFFNLDLKENERN